jgi:hypothetical protein
LQPVGVTSVRNDQASGAFQFNVYLPGFADVSSMRVRAEVGLSGAATAGDIFKLGRSAKSMFRKISLQAPDGSTIDEVMEEHQLDAMIRQLDRRDYANSAGEMQDGSKAIRKTILGASGDRYGTFTGTAAVAGGGAADTITQIAWDAASTNAGRLPNQINLGVLGRGLIGAKVTFFANAATTHAVVAETFITNVSINSSIPLLTLACSGGLTNATAYRYIIDLSTSVGYPDGIYLEEGPAIPAIDSTNTPTVWLPIEIDLMELALARSGKTLPFSILKGAGLKLVFEMARSSQCLLGTGILDVSNIVIHLRNIQLRIWGQNFGQVFNAQTEQQLIERGQLQIPSTKWIVNHSQKAVSSNRIVIAQTASSIRMLLLAIVPNYNGSTMNWAAGSDPFLRSVANIESFQVYAGGKEIPNQAIIVAPTQAVSFEPLSVSAAPLLTATHRYYGGKDAFDEFMRSVHNLSNRDFGGQFQPVNWSQNHYTTTGTFVPGSTSAQTSWSVPWGSFIAAISFEPYLAEGLRSVGLNTATAGTAIEIRLNTGSKIAPAFDYVTAMLVDNMTIFGADGSVSAVY